MNSSDDKIYNLLEKLCERIVGGKNKQIQRAIAQRITNIPDAFSTNEYVGEPMIIAKISAHFSRISLAKSNEFQKYYEEISSYDNVKYLNVVCTFLFLLTDFKTKPNELNNPFEIKVGPFIKPNSGVPPATSSVSSGSYLNKLAAKPNILNAVSTSTSSENYLKLEKFKKAYSGSTTSFGSSHITDDAADNSTNDNYNDIIECALYALTGVQGKYLRKDVVTGEFKLDLRAKNLCYTDAGMLLRLAKVGQLHNEICKFTDPKSDSYLLGVLGQGMMSVLQNELTSFYGLVSMLQEQLQRQQQACMYSWDDKLDDKLTLARVMIWISAPQHRLLWLSTIAASCKGLKGGALASAVYNYRFHGDPKVKSLVLELLSAICLPLQQMMNRWLIEGEIEDPQSEFFIEMLTDVGFDRFWHAKYRIRQSMLPTFINSVMAHKILVTGKSINFLRTVCEDKTMLKGRKELKECFDENSNDLFAPVSNTKLHTMIENVYLNTSKKVLDIVMGPHKLLGHLQSMRKYLLLGQGDFIDLLMENLKPELDRPAKDLYRHDLFSIMATAIRSTTAQYDDQEILEHLDVRLLEPFEGDTGWDIFTLQYTVRGPLSTILEPYMSKYQLLFKPLWSTKHVEFVLSKIWKEQKLNAKSLRSMKDILHSVTYRLQLYTSEMIHFIHQMQYYILFEVIECSWAQLLKRIQTAKTLDDILEAHTDFLESLRIGTFSDEKSNVLYSNLELIYNYIMKLEDWQNIFYKLCFKELHERKDFDDYVIQSELSGEYGITIEQRLKRDENLKSFEQKMMNCQNVLESIGNEYECSVKQFLLTLTSTGDHKLQLFGVRLDFNEYYKKRDHRLTQPLTFGDIRNSLMYSSSKDINHIHKLKENDLVALDHISNNLIPSNSYIISKTVSVNDDILFKQISAEIESPKCCYRANDKTINLSTKENVNLDLNLSKISSIHIQPIHDDGNPYTIDSPFFDAYLNNSHASPCVEAYSEILYSSNPPYQSVITSANVADKLKSEKHASNHSTEATDKLVKIKSMYFYNNCCVLM